MSIFEKIFKNQHLDKGLRHKMVNLLIKLKLRSDGKGIKRRRISIGPHK